MKKLQDNVFYIGVDDNELDLFEGQYIIPEGMAYNSYLILDDKVAVMDSVDASKAGEWLANLESALQGRKPDYLVVHHMEPDHSGSVAAFAQRYPDAVIVAGAMALKFLGQFAPGVAFKTQAVKEGDTLELGRSGLRFFSAAMVHWPEVMVSVYEGILFSADAFGKFGSLGKCGYFIDEDSDWACEARRYYFNICGKYGPQVQALLRKADAASPSVIAPLHGPILRGDLKPYLDLYRIWSSYGVETEGVFIAYASIHGGTRDAALKLADMLKDAGCPKVALSDLCRDDMAEAVEDAFRYGRMILCASSYDAGLFTPAYNFLHTLQMKAWQKKKVGLLENGTWAPSAGRVMKEMLAAMKDIEILEPVVTIRSRHTSADLPSMEALVAAVYPVA